LSSLLIVIYFNTLLYNWLLNLYSFCSKWYYWLGYWCGYDYYCCYSGSSEYDFLMNRITRTITRNMMSLVGLILSIKLLNEGSLGICLMICSLDLIFW